MSVACTFTVQQPKRWVEENKTLICAGAWMLKTAAKVAAASAGVGSLLPDGFFPEVPDGMDFEFPEFTVDDLVDGIADGCGLGEIDNEAPESLQNRGKKAAEVPAEQVTITMQLQL